MSATNQAKVNGPEPGEMHPPGKMRRWLIRGLLLGIGGVVLIGLCEVAFRAVGVSYPVFDTYDHHRGIKLRPGKEGWYRKEGNAYLTINSRGYRDVEHEVAKPPGVFRVAFLGDSMTEARQVDIKDAYWRRLEENLASCSALGGRRVEALNFGIGGYSTTQQLLTLELDVLDFSPDLVVLALTTGNDIAENSRRIMLTTGWGHVFRPFHVVSDGQMTVDASFRDFSLGYLRRRLALELIHHSKTLEVVNQGRRALQIRRLRANAQQQGGETELGHYEMVYVPPPDEAWRDAWAITEKLLQRMRRKVSEAGASFVVMTGTNPIQVDPDSEKRETLQRYLGVKDLFYPERRVRQLGELHGFPVITLAQRLQAVAVANQLYLHGFENQVVGLGHWNEDGHRWVAQVLAEELCGGGLLP